MTQPKRVSHNTSAAAAVSVHSCAWLAWEMVNGISQASSFLCTSPAQSSRICFVLSVLSIGSCVVCLCSGREHRSRGKWHTCNTNLSAGGLQTGTARGQFVIAPRFTCKAANPDHFFGAQSKPKRRQQEPRCPQGSLMDPVQGCAVSELLEIVRRTEGEHEHEDDAANLVESLPRTNADFEGCRLRSTLCDQLEAHLGAAVDEALASDELEVSASGGARPSAIDEVVARLTASPRFVGMVENARVTVQQAAGVQRIAAGATATTAAAPAAGNSSTPILNAATGNFLRRTVDALSSSDTEREGMQHVNKKPARRDDWVGIFDLGGGFGAGSGGFSPRVDIEGALGQLEAGLESPGPGSATSAVEALGLLAEVTEGTKQQQQRSLFVACVFSLRRVFVVTGKYQCTVFDRFDTPIEATLRAGWSSRGAQRISEVGYVVLSRMVTRGQKAARHETRPAAHNL